MISPADVFCLAIIVSLMVLEGYRGAIPAVVDFLCVIIGVVIIRTKFADVTQYVQPPSLAYALLMGLVVALTALTSLFISRRLRVDVTAAESAIGASLGLFTGLVLSFAFFEWLTIRYGSYNTLTVNSVLSWHIYEMHGLRDFVELFRTLTGH